jgi:hypothetical protein
MTAAPHACQLLSLLSILPDGLSDVELLQSALPLENILACKSTLLRTALAYTDGKKRLKALVLVQEYMQKHHPPNNSLTHSLSKHYQELLELYGKYDGTMSNAEVVARVASNFANIQNVLLHCLSSDQPHLPEIIHSICELSRYSRLTRRGHIPLLDLVAKSMPQPTDHKLEAYFIIQRLNESFHRPLPNANQLVELAQEHFKHFDDPDMQCKWIPDLSICSSS